MEVKQELEDVQKVEIHGHFFPTKQWATQEDNDQTNYPIKSEFVSMKQEIDDDLRRDYYKEPFINASKIHKSIYSADIKSSLVQVNGMKQSKKGDGKSIKKQNIRNRIFLCIVCGHMCKKKIEFFCHFSSNHFFNQKNLFRTRTRRKYKKIKNQVTNRGTSLSANVKDEIEIIEHELKEEMDENGEHTNSFKITDESKQPSNETVLRDYMCYCSKTDGKPIKRETLEDSEQIELCCQINGKSLESNCSTKFFRKVLTRQLRIYTESISDTNLYEDTGTEYIPSTDTTKLGNLQYSSTNYESFHHKETSINDFDEYNTHNNVQSLRNADFDLNLSHLQQYQNNLDNSSINFSFNSMKLDLKNYQIPCSPKTASIKDPPSLVPYDDEINEGKRVRRKHHCQFCRSNVDNFARHLERDHTDKNSKKRKRILDKLRREGDFVLSEIIPVVTKKNENNNSHFPCKFCKGYFTAKYLRKHVKKCCPNPSARFQAKIKGQNLMVGHLEPQDILRVSGLLTGLAADEISCVAKKDKIIAEVARCYIKRQEDRHLLIVAKRMMRRLSRLLISVRKNLNMSKLTLMQALVPSNFSTLIRATKEIAEYDEVSESYKSPSLALQMGALIKHAINAAISLETQKEIPDKVQLKQFSYLTSLLKTHWASEISNAANQNLHINKFNKSSLIPVTEEHIKFKGNVEYLPTRSRALRQQNKKLPTVSGVQLPKGKRKLVYWTEKQKKLTEAHFKKHIKQRISPRKFEVLKLISEYPDVFANKTWPVIKAYVYNKYRKK